jgi:pyridoxal 5'-phosphate synthase pdxT subunit
VERVGDDVDVLARHHDVPVLVRQGNVVVASFHPELTDDHRIHRWFVDTIVHAATAA